MTASLVRFGPTRADRARPALRSTRGPVVCRLVYQAGRRTAMHSWSWAAVGPTSDLVHTRASALASQGVRSVYPHVYPVRPRSVRAHASRQGARHHISSAALRLFLQAGAGSARVRSERLVLFGRAARKPGACLTALSTPEVVLDPPNHLSVLCDRCQATWTLCCFQAPLGRIDLPAAFEEPIDRRNRLQARVLEDRSF